MSLSANFFSPDVSAPHLLVADELERVEKTLTYQIQSREPLLREISDYLVSAGGKRARPAVALLVFRACGGVDPSDIIDIATALELIHSASLLHDDIIDGGETRRGKPSAYRRYGLAETLVAGDFLFGRAFAMCGRFEEKVISWTTEACIRLTEGEIMQGRFRRNPAVTTEDYLEIISRKTASLFSQCARLGAYMAGASDLVVESLANCGYCSGMAFQIVDDLLDVEGDGDLTGKMIGIDLQDGNPSLPLVMAIPHDDEIRRVFEKTDPTAEEVQSVLKRIRQSGVMPEAQRLARSYGQQAMASLEHLEPSPYYDSLVCFVQQLIDRTG